MTRDEFSEAYKNGRRNFRGADLSGADLRGMNLRDADLHGVDLSGADLRGADLNRANLSDTNLCGADLRGALLRDTNLHGVDLRGADLRGVNIDFASWPMWCGSLKTKVDRKIFLQVLGHALALDVRDDNDNSDIMAEAVREALIDLIGEYHRSEIPKAIRERIENK